MYKSPIEILTGSPIFDFDGEIIKAVQKYEISVDEKELVKALAYDRCQYEKGYTDAKNEIVKCKECKHHGIPAFSNSAGTMKCFKWDCYVKPADFCSYGERRDR